MDEIDAQLKSLSHKESIQRVLETGFRSIFLPNLERLSEVASFVAPEHLELQVSEENLDFLTERITTAGAFLMGHKTATSLGDFAAGPNPFFHGQVIAFFFGP